MMRQNEPRLKAHDPPGAKLRIHERASNNEQMELMSNVQDGFDEDKPSIFELLSEQQLASLLPPSLRYVLAVATHRHPRYLLPLLNSFDEVYALLMVVIERYYLSTHGGGFTENFYGLKRERTLRIRGGEIPRAQAGAAGIVRETLKLRKSDIWKNLVVLVGVPYLKRKLDESYDIHAPQASILGPTFYRDQLPPNPTFKQRLLHNYRWFLKNIYPCINAAYAFSILAFNLAYLFDKSKYHSPLLWLIGTRIRRLNSADYRAIALATESKSSRPGGGGSRGFTSALNARLLSSLKILLPTSIFALKFLEWWHASDFARQLSRKTLEGLDLPPPLVSGQKKASPGSEKEKEDEKEQKPERKAPIALPSNLPVLTVPMQPDARSSLCPICLHPIVTPTACQTGYVFCYKCIHKWIEGSHERQLAFMEGGGGEEGWAEAEGSREGRWESGQGRCAVTGRRVLGGTNGLRRIMA